MEGVGSEIFQGLILLPGAIAESVAVGWPVARVWDDRASGPGCVTRLRQVSRPIACARSEDGAERPWVRGQARSYGRDLRRGRRPSRRSDLGREPGTRTTPGIAPVRGRARSYTMSVGVFLPRSPP